MGAPAIWDQDSFRGRDDDGSETGATWKAAINTGWTQPVDENFRVRFLVQETGGRTETESFQLQYQLNSGGWNDVTGASSVVRASASSQFADGDDCTQQLGSGTFISNNNGMEEADGLAGSCAYAGSDEAEFEFCCQVLSGDVADSDTVELRLVDAAGDALSAYTNSPTLTVSETSGTAYERSAADTPSVSDASSTALDYGRSAADTPAVSDAVQAQIVGIVTGEVDDTATATDAASRSATFERANSSASVRMVGTAIVSSNNLDGTIADIDDPVDSPDANWMTTQYSGDTDITISFDTPASNPTGTQTFRAWVRRDSTGGTDPTAYIYLYLGGVYQSGDAGTAITSTTGQLLEWEWDADTELTGDPDGSEVEFRIWGFRADTAMVEYGAMEWVKAPGADGDSVAVTDAASPDVTLGRSAADTISASDAASTEAAYARTVADTPEVSDGASRELTSPASAIEREVNDTATVSDAGSAALDVLRTASDSATVTDAIAGALDATRTAADTASVTDALAGGLEAARAASDTVAATDAASRQGDWHRVISDTPTAADAVQVEMAGLYERAVADTAAIGDAVTPATDYARTAGDAVSATDAVSTDRELGRSATDTASVSDALSSALDYQRTAGDTASVTDGASRELTAGDSTIERSVADTLATTDAGATALGYARTLDDAAAVADAIAVEIVAERSASDAASVSDSATVGMVLGVTASDAIAATDTITREAAFAVSLADTAATTDSAYTGEAAIEGGPSVDGVMGFGWRASGCLGFGWESGGVLSFGWRTDGEMEG